MWFEKAKRNKELKNRLRNLKPLLASGTEPAYERAFNEFVDHDEFDLALHALCDFLLEPNTAPPQLEDLREIDALHQMMDVTDDCMKRLGEKSGIVYTPGQF
jgi:hypothetical protein